MTTCKFLLLFLPACAVLLLCGCGYHMGSMMHPQVKTIAFAEIQNESIEPALTAMVRGQLAEQFQRDNSLSIKTKETADCILYCRVLSVENDVIRYSTYDGGSTYRPAEFNVRVTAEFTVLIPGRSDPLIPTRTVTGSAHYQYLADFQTAKNVGLKQASYNLARMIVEYTTEAW